MLKVLFRDPLMVDPRGFGDPDLLPGHPGLVYLYSYLAYLLGLEVVFVQSNCTNYIISLRSRLCIEKQLGSANLENQNL